MARPKRQVTLQGDLGMFKLSPSRIMDVARYCADTLNVKGHIEIQCKHHKDPETLGFYSPYNGRRFVRMLLYYAVNQREEATVIKAVAFYMFRAHQHQARIKMQDAPCRRFAERILRHFTGGV